MNEKKIRANAYLCRKKRVRRIPFAFFLFKKKELHNHISFCIGSKWKISSRITLLHKPESIISVNKSNKCSIRMEKGKKKLSLISCWQTCENGLHVVILKNEGVFSLSSSLSSSLCYCPVGKYCSKIVVFNLSEWYTMRLVLVLSLLPLMPSAAASHTQLLLSVAIDRETRSLHTHLAMRAHNTRRTHIHIDGESTRKSRVPRDTMLRAQRIEKA